MAHRADGLNDIFEHNVRVRGNLFGVDGFFNGVVWVGEITISDEGLRNVFIGQSAGSPGDGGDKGQENVAVGCDALMSIDGAEENTAVGDEALRVNTTGDGNTALGNDALQFNTTGSFNTAIGTDALDGNTTADFNVGVGYQCLFKNKIGTFNTALGYQAGYNLVSTDGVDGINNVLIGYQAGFGNTTDTNFTGKNNVAIGTAALRANTTGNANVALGNNALVKNTTGENNMAIGALTLDANIDGNFNVAIGSQALTDNIDGNNNFGLGAFSLWKCNSGSNNIGIGANSLKALTSGGNNVAIGANALQTITTHGGNVAIGYYAGNLNTSSSSIFLGNNAGRYTTSNNNLLISNQNHGNAADELIESLIAGKMNATVANQTLNFNAPKVTQFQHTQTFTGTKTLTDGSATGFVEIAVGTGELVGGDILYTMYIDDGTDLQAHTGAIGFVAVNKAGTVTSNCQETYLNPSSIEIVTSGTLSDAVTCTDGAGKITINMNANTSLNVNPIFHYTIRMHSTNTITAL